MQKSNSFTACLITVFLTLSACGGDDSMTEIIEESTPKLLFKSLNTIDALLFDQYPGFTSNDNTNELYVVYRDLIRTNDGTLTDLGEDILLRYRADENAFSMSRSKFEDFVSRDAHIINDQVWVISSTQMSVYSLDLRTLISRVQSSERPITRFGSATSNGDLYVWGGQVRLSSDEPQPISDKIKRWNTETSSYDIIATMPNAKTWASGEIVNNKLYIFGGQAEWLNTRAQSSIFIYDFADESFTTLELPEIISRSFTAVHGDKILVAGLIGLDIINPDYGGVFLGYFDTTANTFTEIETNLNAVENDVIIDLAILNDKAYVIQGNPVDSRDSYTIMSAEIEF